MDGVGREHFVGTPHIRTTLHVPMWRRMLFPNLIYDYPPRALESSRIIVPYLCCRMGSVLIFVARGQSWYKSTN